MWLYFCIGRTAAHVLICMYIREFEIAPHEIRKSEKSEQLSYTCTCIHTVGNSEPRDAEESEDTLEHTSSSEIDSAPTILSAKPKSARNQSRRRSRGGAVRDSESEHHESYEEEGGESSQSSEKSKQIPRRRPSPKLSLPVSRTSSSRATIVKPSRKSSAAKSRRPARG
jgi:hypothetical protein